MNYSVVIKQILSKEFTMKKLRFILFVLFFGFSLSSVNAQEIDKTIEDPAGNPKLIKFNLTTKTDISDLPNVIYNVVINIERETINSKFVKQ